MTTSQTYHIPVMLNECLNYLNIQPDGIYVDVTFGGGGHSRAILEKLSEKGKLFAFDQDKDAQKNIINDERFTFIPHNFAFIAQWLHYYKVYKVNGILADLGVSLHQFQTPERGFSYRYNYPLDMRMNQQQKLTARDVVNDYSVQQLENIFKEYGDLPNAKKIAHLIQEYRFHQPIETTFDLVKAVKPVLPKVNDYPILSRIFQAIRIEVNKEIENLKSFLNQTYDLLEHKGRLVVLTYHSLEDKIVKHFMIHGHTDKTLTPDPIYGTIQYPFNNLTKKPIEATEEEIKRNPQSRSAKLRAVEKV
ncbi:MAG: ribosomal RNA small subunit methyltransferase H [Bacteroidia bacterium]|nr:MAG: ribosomal RNA small subunit methyltransferase H [Bacteroidia bacterium]